MGRYAWIYIIVPFFASLVAAGWASIDINQTEKLNQSKSA